MESALKGKSLLPLGVYSKRKEFSPVGSLLKVRVCSRLGFGIKGESLLPLGVCSKEESLLPLGIYFKKKEFAPVDSLL